MIKRPNKAAVVFSVFPGLGKTFLADTNSTFADLDYPDLKGDLDAYVKKIKTAIKNKQVPLVPSWLELRNRLNAEGFMVFNVLPKYDSKEEMMTRYQERNSTQTFIDTMDTNYEKFYESMRNDGMVFFCYDPTNTDMTGYLSDHIGTLLNYSLSR